MRKLILLVAVSIIGLNVLNAQNFEQGEKTIAARVSNLDFNVTKSEGQDSKVNFNLGIKGDYFLIDNLALTAGFDYAYVDKENSLFAEIGGKYYFWEYIYGGISYLGTYDYKRLNSAGKIEVGATYYIAENVFIEPAIYFIRGEQTVAVKTANTFSKFGLAVSFGVSF